MKFKVENVADTEALKEVERLWDFSLTGLSGFMSAWVSGQRELAFASGCGQSDRKSKRIYLIFSSGKKKLFDAYLEAGSVLTSQPELQALIPPGIPEDASLMQSLHDDDCDEDDLFFEKRDRLLKASWNEDLCVNMFSLDRSLKIALGCAMGQNGKTTFADARYGLSEFAEPEIDLPDPLFCAQSERWNGSGMICIENFLVDVKTSA